MSKSRNINRRRFLSSVAATAALTVVPRHVLGGTGFTAPSGRLNIACIGMGVQGIGDMKQFLNNPDAQVIAVCDVNKESGGYRGGEIAGREPGRRVVEKHYAAQKTSGTYKGCAAYCDYREMFTKEQENIDAVLVATTVNIHAFAAIAAIRMGKHVYCEKPLAHNVFEARSLTEAARQHKVITQMGIQLHATDRLKNAVEMIASGIIGDVSEIHLWAGSPRWPQGIQRPSETPPVPDSLDWDLWLGPAPRRPYHPVYHPRSWRGWYDFGAGALGDMGCHIFDIAFWALKLGHPTSVEACSSCFIGLDGKKVVNNETYPQASLVRYEFPARANMPPVGLSWYDGGLMPPCPKGLPQNSLPGSGGMYVGERGTIIVPHGGEPILLLKTKTKKTPKPFLPRGIDHYSEWVRACRGGPKPLADFDYSGPLTEAVLLGCVAIRTGKKLVWDGPNMKVTNAPEANRYIRRNYRSGWSL